MRLCFPYVAIAIQRGHNSRGENKYRIVYFIPLIKVTWQGLNDFVMGVLAKHELFSRPQRAFSPQKVKQQSCP